jgi:hypothetical protein
MKKSITYGKGPSYSGMKKAGSVKIHSPAIKFMNGSSPAGGSASPKKKP